VRLVAFFLRTVGAVPPVHYAEQAAFQDTDTDILADILLMIVATMSWNTGFTPPSLIDCRAELCNR